VEEGWWLAINEFQTNSLTRVILGGERGAMLGALKKRKGGSFGTLSLFSSRRRFSLGLGQFKRRLGVSRVMLEHDSRDQ